MLRSLLTFICTVVIVSSLSGCFGMISYQPGECENEAPKQQNKAEYLKEKGAPGSTMTVSADSEIWVYEEPIWCGVIPCWGICVPLMLPVCDGFERVNFWGDRAERVHTRRTLGYGGFINVLNYFWIPPGSMVVSDPACINRVSRAGYLGQKIEPGRTAALSIRIDTPKHQQDKKYQVVALELESVLAWGLVKGNPPLFKEVVAETVPADYSMEVTLTSVTFPGIFSSQHEAVMTVRITDNRTNLPIGTFEVYSKADKDKEGDSARLSVSQDALVDIRIAIIWSGDSSNSPEIQKQDEDLPTPPETGATAPPPPH